MKLDRYHLIEKSIAEGYIPLFTHDDPEIAFKVLKACYDGGSRIFEYTNRARNAEEVFEYLISRKDELPGLSLGIGTIMDSEQCQTFIDIGADFIICPSLDVEVGSLCVKHNIGWIPGCGTLTEMITANRTGASIIKLFPANVLGPDFIKACLAPCPDLHIMPTGGVIPQSDNLKSWFKAGASCVGMGSQLFNFDWNDPSSFEELKKRSQSLKQMIKEIRNG